MALLELNAATVGMLDRAKSGATFDLAVQRAVLDCINRPGDERERVVTLRIAFKPKSEIFDQTISCESATGKFQVKVKLPDWESQRLSFGVQKRGKAGAAFVFSEDSPEDVKQATFFDDDEESKS